MGPANRYAYDSSGQRVPTKTAITRRLRPFLEEPPRHYQQQQQQETKQQPQPPEKMPEPDPLKVESGALTPPPPLKRTCEQAEHAGGALAGAGAGAAAIARRLPHH